MISEHASEWLGLPVELYNPEKKPDYPGHIYRLATDWDNKVPFDELFSRFTSDPACASAKGIIIGAFHGDDPGATSEVAVQLLVAARNLLPNLRGIFIGDMISEENEISWIRQSDVTPIFEAYPRLEHFRVRGADGLAIGGGIRHDALKSIVFESGGLPAEIIAAIAASQIPAIEHIEIWTGSENYGGDSTVADLKPFLDGAAWPRLRNLGLRDSEYADDIAAALRGEPVLNRLDSLDLSLGNMSDRGGEALLENIELRRLKKLDLHYHFFSEDMERKLMDAFPQADLSDGQGDVEDEDRFISVAE